MDTFDSAAGEYLRLSERYRQMSDEELLLLVPQSSELTPSAQQGLASEVRSRGLKPDAEDAKPSVPSPFKRPAFVAREPTELNGSNDSDSAEPESSEDEYDEDRKLVELRTVWSARDALKVQEILDAAGIPFFIGPEKATSVDKVTSNFANGVSVQIMQVGLPWAGQAMQHYEPEDDPTPQKDEEVGELVVRCPKCQSEEVVFEGGTSTLIVAKDDPSQKYRWSCDSCGYQWEDDGVAQEE
ncbi:MAG: hypothetical protein WCA92_09255 [Terriglobales bacterium]